MNAPDQSHTTSNWVVRQDPELYLVLPINEQACPSLNSIYFVINQSSYNHKCTIPLRADGKQDML